MTIEEEIQQTEQDIFELEMLRLKWLTEDVLQRRCLIQKIKKLGAIQ